MSFFILFEFQVFVDPYLPDELLYMWDEYHRPLIFIECPRYDWEMPEVDMIRRLIEYEKSWLLEWELREDDESLLPLRECADRCRHELTRDQESWRERAEVFIEHFSIWCLEETVIDFLWEVEIREVLTIVSDFYIGSDLYSFRRSFYDRF